MIAGCGSGDAAASGGEQPTAQAPVSTPKTDEPQAGNEAPKEEGFSNVILTDQKDGTEHKESFGKDLGDLYVYFDFNLPVGTKIKGVFYCDKSSMEGVEGKIKEQTMDVDKAANTGNFSISKPEIGWPAGEYHFELYADDKMLDKIPYVIK